MTGPRAAGRTRRRPVVLGVSVFLRSFNEASLTMCSVAGRRSASPVPTSSQGHSPLSSGNPAPLRRGGRRCAGVSALQGRRSVGSRLWVEVVGPAWRSRCLGLKAGLEGSTRPSNALTEEKVGVSVCVE